MTRTGVQAISVAAAQSKNGPAFGEGECLERVHDCYAVGAKYPSATSGWANATAKHHTLDPAKIPAGVPIWWTGGSHGFGHVAISTGAGWCWSTDIHRVGYFDHVPIAEIHDRWGLTFAGWSEDINGVRVYSPTAAPVPPVKPPPPSPGTRISEARVLLLAAIPHRTPAARVRIRAALRLLPKR